MRVGVDATRNFERSIGERRGWTDMDRGRKHCESFWFRVGVQAIDGGEDAAREVSLTIPTDYLP